jgi:hypothetical protein
MQINRCRIVFNNTTSFYLYNFHSQEFYLVLVEFNFLDLSQDAFGSYYMIRILFL